MAPTLDVDVTEALEEMRGYAVRVVVMLRAADPEIEAAPEPLAGAVPLALAEELPVCDAEGEELMDGVSTGTMARTTLLSRSAMNTAPLALTATPAGVCSSARRAGPPSPE